MILKIQSQGLRKARLIIHCDRTRRGIDRENSDTRIGLWIRVVNATDIHGVPADNAVDQTSIAVWLLQVRVCGNNCPNDGAIHRILGNREFLPVRNGRRLVDVVHGDVQSRHCGQGRKVLHRPRASTDRDNLVCFDVIIRDLNLQVIDVERFVIHGIGNRHRPCGVIDCKSVTDVATHDRETITLLRLTIGRVENGIWLGDSIAR